MGNRDQDRARDHERVRQHNELRLVHLLERHGRPRPWELERTGLSTDEWRSRIAAWIASLPEPQRQLREQLVRNGSPLVEEPDLEEPDVVLDERARGMMAVHAARELAGSLERMRKSAEWLRSFGIEVADDGWINAPAKPEQEWEQVQRELRLKLAKQFALRARVLGLTLDEYEFVAAEDIYLWTCDGDDRSLGEQPDEW
jgi:hypothetical protein